MDSSLSSYSTVIQRGKSLFVEARLLGGAPWGFTLKGGLEHGEELIISKVEEGGKADQLEHPLQPGDQVVIINDVELSGFRQEAISLVKGSYKTLRLTIRRECCPGLCCGEPTTLPSLCPPPSSSSSHGPSREGRGSCSGGVKLRIKNRRSEPASRPHSWHSTKLREGQPDPSMMQVSQGGMGAPWHQTYHASASTADLSGYESGYLRKSPDQYSSRGSMESLDHHSHPAYSSCHQLSASKSSNSIDHLHSKRDSAYSSFSTSSSIPEYLTAAPSFSKERSYSMETVPQRGGGGGGAEGMQQADIRYVRTIYDPQQGVSQEHEVSSASAALLRNNEARGGGWYRAGGGGVSHRGSSSSSSSGSGSSGGSNSASNRHSVGPIWGQASSRSSYESLKGAPAPAPPLRSDSYAAIRNHERPNSWSSLEQARSLRAQHKGSWHHSSGSVASGGKGSYGPEGQLHTVIEKSPESSPTTKPKQSSLPAPPHPQASSQSGRLMLPTGIYPVPPPEPHFAQMPTSCPSPSSGVYPALAKESSRHALHQGMGLGVGVSVDGVGVEVALENGYQSNPSSYNTTTTSTSLQTNQPHDHQQHHHHDFTQPKPPPAPALQADRGGHEEAPTKCGQYRPHLRAGGGGGGGGGPPEGQTAVVPRQSHHHHQGHQAHRPSSAQSIGQERRDPYTPVQPRGERPRYPQSQSTEYPENHSHRQGTEEAQSKHTEHSHSTHAEPEPLPSKIAQGQVAQGGRGISSTTTITTPAQGSKVDQRGSAHLRHYSDSSAIHQREHPLTRLENALAEVQRCVSPESSQGNHKGSARSLSVLEKVSRFERREQGKPRSQSTSHASQHGSQHANLGTSRPNQPQPHERSKSTLASMEDLRNMLERSNSNGPSVAQRTHNSASSHGTGMVAHEGHREQRRGSSEHPELRGLQDPALVLQRSRSTFQLGQDENGQDQNFPWRDDLQDLLGTIQDTSFNRTYRDSLKDAQSKVLRSTSFRRRDLSVSSVSPPPVPTKHLSLDRKAPKTSPKPTSNIVSTSLTTTSPHTPKERHVVTPPEVERERYSPPELPSVPAVGPPVRIGGRKRLTMEQKKRSYSEPENMHEVGMSDGESSSHRKFLLTETSVSDRRRMFEMAVSRSMSGAGGGAPPQAATYRPELRQQQQDALAEYMERKRGVRRSEGGRPHSAYLQPGSSSSDTWSFSSTSSLMSLQDPGLDGFSGGGRLCSTLPPGLYPGRATTRPTQAPVAHLVDPHGPVTTHRPQDRAWEGELFRPSSAQAFEPLRSQEFSQQRDGAFERVAPARSSGKSASAEDLLERSEKRPAPQHFRSRSSPSVERLNQDFMGGDLRMFGIFSTEPQLFTLTDNRAIESQKAEKLASAASQQRVERYMLNQGPSQNNTPVIRRERQRNPDRQRANSASGLAASVGLPCPFSPPGTPGTPTSQDWQASERLSQANLDAIAFPCLMDSANADANAKANFSPCHPDGQRDVATQGVTRQSSSDTSTSEETLKDFPREGPCPQALAAPKTAPPPPSHPPPRPPHREGREKPSSPPLSLTTTSSSHCPSSPRPQPLPSLRISESSLQMAPPPVFSQDDDEVFLPPPPPSPPSSPPAVRETDIIEDFPPPPSFLPPPPPPAREKEEDQMESGRHEQRTSDSSAFMDAVRSERKQSIPSPPLVPPSGTPRSAPLRPPSLNTEPEPQPLSPTSLLSEERPSGGTVAAAPEACEAQESLGPEYQLLPRRERSAEELRVEALARQLVSRDRSLTPILDTWGGKNTLDLMEEIFPSDGGKSPWQRRGSSWLEDRRQDDSCSTGHAQSQSPDGGMETDLDEEADLNQRKVELLQALTLSVASLRGEREELGEEQRRYKALGGHMEALVQERCKPNEWDKYRMFIGDLDKIVNLLLSLCGRLVRVDNTLSAMERQEEMEDGAEERESLQQKRRQLCSQHEDARELKENLDRRERVVLDILGGYLSGSQLRDYQHFVRMKPALLIRQRHLDELIKQGDEQLNKLAESLPPEHHTQQALSPAPSPGHTHSARSPTVTSL